MGARSAEAPGEALGERAPIVPRRQRSSLFDHGFDRGAALENRPQCLLDRFRVAVGHPHAVPIVEPTRHALRGSGRPHHTSGQPEARTRSSKAEEIAGPSETIAAEACASHEDSASRGGGPTG